MKASVVMLAAMGVWALAATAQAATTQTANPAGIGDYSYIQVQRSQLGSSRYFGESAQGNGFKASYQYNRNTFIYGDFDRLGFDHGGYLYHTGIGFGYAQTMGKVSAYLLGGVYRDIAVGNSRPGRSYYWQFAYGLRGSLTRWLALEGELYSNFHPDFASVPWGVKFGVAFALGPVSLHVVDNRNRDVNTLSAMLRIAF